MSKKILLIDDDPVSVKMIRFGLVERGYDVFCAADGEEGMSKVRKEEPDLIVLDVHMPNMNGYEFLTELKRVQGVNMTPIITLTANETLEDVFKLEGVKAYIVKPVNLSDLVMKIEECLKESGA